jgi:hypothetical protein
MYPEKGENNLNGWDNVLDLDDSGIDSSRIPKNQLWTAF